ncbi:hypothetical protein PHLCEN_2v5267 [Hermanssonia centrifuga]|uniref:Uncharacterized protein n=1 Tax=Hermanssonia centrifuga TaxID=98765 RepID=A0A2R6P8N9_9APHY|nr:hypothetical protein PHLCEN_2v5267 [Hermanssonia centrifuga]
MNMDSSLPTSTATSVPVYSTSSATVLVTSTQSSSISVPTSTPTNSASAASVSSDNHNRAYLGIAFGAIAAIAFFIALVTWFFRIRPRAIKNPTSWPWDADDHHVEDGLGRLHGLGLGNTWATSNVDDLKDPNVYGPSLTLPRCSLAYPSNVVDRDDVLHSTRNVPVPNSPYPTVKLHIAHQSVPDLAPDLGRLQVTNYVPGDVSSEDGSRANSRQGMVHDSDSSQPAWSPLRIRKSGSSPGLAVIDEKSANDITEWPVLPLPGETPSDPLPAPSQGGWASSLRSNLVNAIHAAIGGPGTTPQECLTPAPRRISRQSSRNSAGSGMLSRRSSIRTKLSNRSRGHQNGRDTPASNPFVVDPNDLITALSNVMSAVPEEDIKRPPPALVKSRDRSHIPGPPSLSRHSSIHSAVSLTENKDTSALVLELPGIPSMSRTSTNSSFHQAVQRKALNLRKSRKYPNDRPHRPTLVTRLSSSECSVGSDMSRSSSVISGPLTDQEQFAQRALRERRKRVSAARKGVVKQSIRRPGARLTSRRPRGTVKTDVPSERSF